MEISVYIFCSKCGRPLDEHHSKGNDIYVEPCEYCVNDRYADGLDEGRAEGRERGYDES
jgi:hypothetical protein